MKYLFKIWNNFASIGVCPEMETKIKSQIKITNKVSLFTSVSCFIYFFLYFINSEYYLAYLNLFFGITFPLIIVLNKLKKNLFANLFLIILINIFLIIFANLLGKDYSIYIGFILPVAISFIYFGTTKKRFLILSISISILSYLVLEITDYRLVEKIIIPGNHFYVNQYSTVLCVFALLIIIFNSFVRNIEKVENELKTHKQNLEKEIEQRTIELQTQNNELINAKKQADEKENHILNITNNLPVVIAYVDTNLVYQFVNKQYEIWFNKPKSEIVGKTPIELLDSDSYKKALPFIQRALQGEKIEFENIILNHNKEKRYLQTNYVPKIDLDNKITGIYVLGIDITDKKNYELELIKAKDKAEESDRLKSSFLQNMSHEVRTPLNAIAGFSQLIANQNVNPEKLKIYSKIISDNSDKLIGIITDVIEISQIQANQSILRFEEIEISELFNNIINSFNEKIEEKNLKYIVNLDNNVIDYKTFTDIDKFKKLIFHLIDNAIKFTTEGKVEINCKIENQNLVFSVTDSGIGISQETQSLIFDVFRQLENGTCRNYGGNGLGLAIVKSYTEMLDGTVTLTSELNVGTCISVSIPLQKQNKNNIANVKKNNIKTVLIVEDELSNYEYLLALLETMDIKILYANNGQKAVDMCRNNNSIDLILMDIKMPIMDGISATKIIKEFRKDIPIIAQTAYYPDESNEKLNNIFDDIITKPITEKEMIEKLQKHFVI